MVSDELYTCAMRVRPSVGISLNKGDITLSRKPGPCGASSRESNKNILSILKILKTVTTKTMIIT